MEQRKGIVQMYIASVQQIGRTLRDKGEKEWKEVLARANNNTYLKQAQQNMFKLIVKNQCVDIRVYIYYVLETVWLWEMYTYI